MSEWMKKGIGQKWLICQADTVQRNPEHLLTTIRDRILHKLHTRINKYRTWLSKPVQTNAPFQPDVQERDLCEHQVHAIVRAVHGYANRLTISTIAKVDSWVRWKGKAVHVDQDPGGGKAEVATDDGQDRASQHPGHVQPDIQLVHAAIRLPSRNFQAVWRRWYEPDSV